VGKVTKALEALKDIEALQSDEGPGVMKMMKALG